MRILQYSFSVLGFLISASMASATAPLDLDSQEVLNRYDYLDPNHFVPTDLLQKAVLYFDSNKRRFNNQNYITVVDYRPSSVEYRLFVISLQNGSVERFHTSHGNGSVDGDPAYAVKFGNRGGSNMSSLGFAKINQVYTGSLGRSVRLDGLSSTNSNIRRRGIVLHGSDAVHEAPVVQGVSGGCIMLDLAVRDAVIDKLRGGSLLLVDVSQAP